MAQVWPAPPVSIQRGVAAAVAATFVTVNFPAPFAAAPTVVVSVVSGAGSSVGATALVFGVTETGFQLRSTVTVGVAWVAVG